MEDFTHTTWHQQTCEEVAKTLSTSATEGLSTKEAVARLSTIGFNQLPEQKRISPFKIFLRQFSSLIVWLLIFAAIIAGCLGELVDQAAILVVIVLNAVLGFFQEYRAEKSIAALRKMVTPTSKVLRAGKLQTIAAKELVPGDLVLLEAGDTVPADGRLVETNEFATQEAALTGESTPVSKHTTAISKENLPLGDRKNMAFLGTYVVRGKGFMIVTATALTTELGKIAALLQQETNEETPLQVRLEELGRRLVWICLAVVFLVFILGHIRGTPFVDNLLLSLSLAVAAIPEGLPAIVTIALSIGVHRMAKQNALVRKLPSVETLGCTTVICSDKTGTLTQNEMTVQAIWINDAIIQVSGIGYKPEGIFTIATKTVDPQHTPDLMTALKICLLCNSAELVKNEENTWGVIGDPTEGALLSVAYKASLTKKSMEQEYRRIGEIPFDSDRKMMSVVRHREAETLLFIKGAPDVILSRSQFIASQGNSIPLTAELREQILHTNTSFANKALRVLAVGYRSIPSDLPIERSLEQELVFVGLVAMMDPPRDEVKKAIETCVAAGITPVMITGDHKETAIAVARTLTMLKHNSLAITGAELEQMDDSTLKEKVQNISIYARTSATDKLRIVRAWKATGNVVAMTGDGVNDAPAIREADIGVAMGITGTDVTKEASDMVILDDNFTSIVHAVKEGRGIYDNIIKFVNYLLSSNIAEILIILFGMILGLKDPSGRPFIALSAAQLLWLNLVTDGLPAITLGFDPVDPRAMQRPPRNPFESILPLRFLAQIFSISVAISIGTLGACIVGLQESAALGQTIAFTTLVVLELVRVQMVRAQYRMGFFSNPYIIFALASSLALQLLVIYVPFLQVLFGTVPLQLNHWAIIALASIGVWSASLCINHLFDKQPKAKNSKLEF